MNKELSSKLMLLLLLAATQLGCGAGKADSGDTLLTDITYSDAGVQKCVFTNAAREGWLTIEEVTTLSCSKISKDQVVYGEEGIWSTTDLEKFVYLEDLDISGHYYTSFKTSSLTLLKHLTMDMSFIKSLDLSENLLIETLDVGGTLITQLDLRNNLALVDLRATAESYHTGLYQIWAIEGIDDLLEEAGLAYDRGAELREITLEAIVNRPLEVVLNNGAKLEYLDVISDAVITYVD